MVDPVMTFNLMSSRVTMETNLQISGISIRLFLDWIEEGRPTTTWARGLKLNEKKKVS